MSTRIMNRSLAGISLISLFCAWAALLLTAAPATAQTAKTTLAKIQYRKRILANGLTVYSVRNRHSPTVAIQVWYKVGSKDDPGSRSGFAHLFEHMMFKSTRNMASETMDRLTEDVGGENNAFTAEDMTVYFEVVPSNYLETLLWAEAERMGNLSVVEGNFASERSVVQEEYRQSVLAPPYGRLGVLINEHSFTVHPYKRDTIGSIADLQAASLFDVQKFHQTYYRADNAVLIVVGDFDPAQLDGWVNKYFGRIGKYSEPIPRVTIAEPMRTGEKRFKETAPNVPLPALAVTYLTPPVSHPDAQALRLAQVLLSSGESSRLYRAMVYEQQIAQDANARADLRADAGLFTLTVTAASGKTLSAIEKSLFAEITKLQRAPVSAAELLKARNQLMASTLSERETNEGIAFALGNAAVVLKDPERINTDIVRLQAVTAADIMRVAKKYFVPQNRVVISYEKSANKAKGTQTAATNPPPVEKPQEGASQLPKLPNPFEKHEEHEEDEEEEDKEKEGKEKETPPAPANPRSAVFPTPVEKQLPNGLRVVVIPRPGSGLVSAEMVVRAGGAADPTKAAGLANFTASLLTRGTATRTAPKIAEEIEAIGGSISANAAWDGTFVSLSILKTNLTAAMPLYAEVIRRPAFATAEVERLRAEEVDQLGVSLESPGTLASYVAARVAFGSGPYGHPRGGTIESLKGITPKDVADFHKVYYQPGNAVLVLGGDLTPSEGFALAQRFFGDWKRAVGAGNMAPSVAQMIPSPPTRPGRVVVVDKPDAGQTAVVLIRWAIARSSADYYKALVANSVLGGGFSSRLNQEVRIKRGLSYGAFSSIAPRRLIGPFVASTQTKNETAPDVAILLRDELAILATAPLLPKELTPRKAALTGSYARSLETGSGLTEEVAELALFQRPFSELANYLPGVQAVTAEQVTEFASRILKAENADLILVGDGSKFLPALKAKFPNVEVIPASKIDLNQVKLMR